MGEAGRQVCHRKGAGGRALSSDLGQLYSSPVPPSTCYPALAFGTTQRIGIQDFVGKAERDSEGKRHIAIATEGALMGSLLAHGLPTQMAVVSDDAGQFNVFRHGLCWIHAERIILRLIPLNETHRREQQCVRQQIWDLYADLKMYKAAPNDELKEDITARFEHLCATRTHFATLGQALKRLHRNKAELLLVLEKPWLPLHNNLSESDIREYAKKRKISGSTRSDEGRRCRDTFASLKKTCRKHGVSFWEYLKDRVSGQNLIPPLTEYIRQAAHSRM